MRKGEEEGGREGEREGEGICRRSVLHKWQLTDHNKPVTHLCIIIRYSTSAQSTHDYVTSPSGVGHLDTIYMYPAIRPTSGCVHCTYTTHIPGSERHTNFMLEELFTYALPFTSL